MKGYPNQVADLNKLALGLAIVERLNAQGGNSKSYDALGEALVRGGVLGTGHTPMPVDEYLAAQRTKSGSYQSHQTGARGLREQYRLLGLIDDNGDRVELTPAGRRIASLASSGLGDEQKDYWRRLIRNISHPGEDGARSHPYQVLLRLVERKPGITRAKSALALEARDDSEDELDRIVGLADLSEEEIRRRIGETKSNWDNAKKILPKFAEQLGDVVKVGQQLYLAASPGEAQIGDCVPVQEEEIRRTRRSSRVTAETIGGARTVDNFDEVDPPIAESDPARLAAAIKVRRDRLRRHNLLVKEIARLYERESLELYQGRYDCLASGRLVGFLNEIKTLDGSPEDEAAQVRDLLGQLLYYEPFVRREMGEGVIHKVGVFESPITVDHIQLLQDHGIVCVWKEGENFAGGPGADELLGPYIEELR